MSGTVVFEDAKLQAVELIAETVTLNNFSVSTATTFQQTTNASNVTTNTLRFTNPTTAFVTTGNVEVGTANLFVDTATGRVGIGTGSPDEKLHVHVNDTSHTQLTLRNENAAHRTGIRIKNAGGQDFNIQHVGGVGMGSNAAIIENYSTTNGGIEFYNKGDGKYTFRTTDSNNLRFSILNNGNVGVGDITPSSKLHVDGDVRMKTLSTNAIGKITPVYARGTGANNNANRIVRIGDTTHVNGTGRGLTLTIINASTHAHVSSTNYDTYGNQTDSNNLATALEGMTDAQIGILTSWDAFEDNMTGNLVTACFKLGLTRLAGANDDNNRHPYCAIFYGLGDTTGGGNHAIEVMKADRAGSAYATLSTFLVDDSFMGQTVTNALYSGTADNTTPTVFVSKDKNVGVGTRDPGSLLSIESTTGNHMRLNYNADWYNVIERDSSGDLNFLEKRGASGSLVNHMTIKTAGNVGIGTATPYAKLQVHGNSGAISGGSARRWWYHTAGFSNDGAGSWSALSIYANSDVASGGYFVSANGTMGSSDERIKKNIVDADDAECLEVLRQLKPKKYKYKDNIDRGEEPVWGFIAQEVANVLPHATQLRQDVIPNIYELSNVSSSNVITFTNFNTADLESNATTLIRTIGADGIEHGIHLEEVIDEHTIRVEEDLTEWIGSVDESGNVVAGNQLFVYGQQVNDFVFLKKESIFTVATSALQEVDRQLQAEKTKTATLETQVAALLERVTALENA